MNKKYGIWRHVIWTIILLIALVVILLCDFGTNKQRDYRTPYDYINQGCVFLEPPTPQVSMEPQPEPTPQVWNGFSYFPTDEYYLQSPGVLRIFEGQTINDWTGTSATIEIPAEIDGVKMLRVSMAFWWKDTLTTVSFPDSTMAIAARAFYDCANLNKVVIHDKLIFEGNPFIQCPSLKEIVVDEDSSRYCLIDDCLCDADTQTLIVPTTKEMTKCYVPNGIMKIANYAYWGRTDLLEANFPDSIVEIGSSAFRGCANLSQITFPRSLARIGNEAFGHCNSLATIRIPEGVKIIEKYAFSNCENLCEVYLPTSIEKMEEYVFEGCPNIHLIVTEGSYAEKWAKENGLNYYYMI